MADSPTPPLPTRDELRAAAVARVRAENPDADKLTVDEFHEHFAGGVLVRVEYAEKGKEYEAYAFYFEGRWHYFDDEEALVDFVKARPVAPDAAEKIHRAGGGRPPARPRPERAARGPSNYRGNAGALVRVGRAVGMGLVRR